MNLPEGWTTWGPIRYDCIVVEHPLHGLVTINYRTRGYALGGGSRVPTMGYTGRGWRDALELDAIAALAKIYNEDEK